MSVVTPPPTPPHPTSRRERHRHPSATSSRTRGSQRKRPVSAPPTQAHGASKRHPSSHGCREHLHASEATNPPSIPRNRPSPSTRLGHLCPTTQTAGAPRAHGSRGLWIRKQGGFPFRPWRRNRALLKVWPPRLSDATPRLVHFGPRPYLRAEISNAPGPTRPGPQAEE